MAKEEHVARIRFGGFELQPRERQLLANGHPIALGPRAFDLLVVLVERAGKLVGKSEILDLVWPNLVVEENNLQVHVSALRKVLGSEAIVTVPGHGYRFTLEVTAIGTETGLPATGTRQGLSQEAMSSVGRAPEVADIATPRTSRPRSAFVLAGLLVALLAGTGALLYRQHTPSPTATRGPAAMSLAMGRFTASGAEATEYAAVLRQQIAIGMAALEKVVKVRDGPGQPGDSEKGRGAREKWVADARYVLNGEIRRTAAGHIATLSLVDALSQEQRWSNSFTIPDADNSDRSAVALRKLLAAVSEAVTVAETRRVVDRPIEQLDATELWLLGRDPEPTLAGARANTQLFDRALRLEPNNIMVLRGRAIAVDHENDLDPNPDHGRVVREFDQLTARALKLDPTWPSSWIYRAWALGYLEQWNAALQACDVGIRLDPYNSFYYAQKAWLLSMSGRPEEALVETAKGLELDPGSEDTMRMACEAHILLGHPRQAIELCEKASALDPYEWIAYLFLAAAYADIGDMEKSAFAKAAVEKNLPGYTIAQLRAKGYSNHPEYLKLAEQHWYPGLRKAGFPEK